MSDNQHYVYGFHAVEFHLKKNQHKAARQLYVLQSRADKRLESIQRLAESQSMNIRFVQREVLDRMVDGNHQGVIVATSNKTEVYDEAYLKSHLLQLMAEQQPPFILVLDGVTDPHNLGACLRSAEAAGVQFVIVPKDNAASINSTVMKVACGAAEVLPLIRVTNITRTLKWLQKQGVWVVGAAGEAKNNYCQVELTGPLALVMGSEGKGLRRLTRETCDCLVHIPMQGSVSSLNVSVAVGICLFEALRQRKNIM